MESNATHSFLNDDPLLALTQHQALVKPLIDIVLQNTAGHRGRLLSWRPIYIRQTKNIKKIFESNPMVTVETVLLGPNVDRLSEEAKKVSISAKVLRIDDRISGEKYGILYMESLRLEENPVEILQKCAEHLVTPTGFILISEIVSKSAQIVVNCLEKSQFSTSPKFRTDSEWKKIFAVAGLNLVASRTDGLMFGLYLLRSPQPETSSPTVVFCEDLRDFTWLPELQSQLEAHKSLPDPRVWTVTENATESGLRALSRCIKEEDPLRIQIRSMMNVGTAPAKFDLNSLEIRTIMTNDLACNEYRNGLWGTSVFFGISEDELAAKIPCENAHITVQNRGDLSTLRWVESANKFWKIQVRNVPKSVFN